MEDLKMEKDKSYLVKITDIQDGKKQVHSKYKFFICGEEVKTKKPFKGEYLCPILAGVNIQEAVLAEFPIGLSRWVKCWQVSPNLGTPSIDPCEEPGTSIRSAAALVGGLGNTHMGLNNKPSIPYMPNCASVQINGSSISFATAYAKDILVAEIEANSKHQEITEITDNDIDRMLGWADRINKHFCDQINYAAGGRDSG